MSKETYRILAVSLMAMILMAILVISYFHDLNKAFQNGYDKGVAECSK